MKDFKINIEKIKSEARKNIGEGPVTPSYTCNKEEVINILNQALATEIVCVLRYKAHYEMAKGIHSTAIAAEFLEHAKEEDMHVAMLAERISQLGGEANYDPTDLATRSHTEYSVSEDIKEMLREDLIAERIVIGIYQEFIRFLGNDDPTTRMVLEAILKDEEQHADDLVSLLQQGEATVSKVPFATASKETRQAQVV